MFDEVAVYYPRGEHTGGPEALHQLVDSLRRHGHEAYLVPMGGTHHKPRSTIYTMYDAPERPTAPDLGSAAIVVPELEVGNVRHIRNATIFRWWLSINFAPTEGRAIERLERALGLREEVPPMPWHHRVGTTLKHNRDAKKVARLAEHERQNSRPIVDLTQSQYAWSHIYGKARRPPTMIGDYIALPDEMVAAGVPVSERRRAVCFNPKKSGHLAREVAAQLPDVDFVPIENMSRAEVVRTLGKCAVYLDLGAHPGKDRIPREAALAGAVVVVAARGSAAFHSDVPLPLQHKVSFDHDVVDSARAVLVDVFADLDLAARQQDPYRLQIAREKAVFDAQVTAVFTHGLRGFDADYPIADSVASRY